MVDITDSLFVRFIHLLIVIFYHGMVASLQNSFSCKQNNMSVADTGELVARGGLKMNANLALCLYHCSDIHVPPQRPISVRYVMFKIATHWRTFEFSLSMVMLGCRALSNGYLLRGVGNNDQPIYNFIGIHMMMVTYI